MRVQNQLYFTVKPQATAFSKVKAGKKKMTAEVEEEITNQWL